MAKAERLYSATEAAYMCRLSIGSFRVKVSGLKVKGIKQGAKVFYTHAQVEDIHNGIPAKPKKAKK